MNYLVSLVRCVDYLGCKRNNTDLTQAFINTPCAFYYNNTTAHVLLQYRSATYTTRCNCRIENTTCRIVQKILYSPNRTNRSNRQASTRVPEYSEIFHYMKCKWQIDNSTCWIVQKILYSPNRTNRSNRTFFPIGSS